MDTTNNKPVLTGYKIIANYIGIFMMMIGVIILFPLIMLIFYPNEVNQAYCFIVPGISVIFLGYLIHFFFRGTQMGHLEKGHDALLVVLVWIISIVSSAFPFILNGYTFTEAVFECTSGYTTTGLSVVDIPNTGKMFLFFRSVMLFVGGVGLVLVLTAAISDRYGLKLYTAEGHTDKLLPNLAKSARLILAIYSGYILLGTIAYLIAGMDLFDSLNHSIAALSTGGFSTKPGNIADYNSVPIDIISVVLMLLGQTNFMIHLYLFRGQLKKVWKHCEIRFICLFTVIMLPLLTLILFFTNTMEYTFGESLNISLFQYVSCLSTTGFANIQLDELLKLPHSFMMLLILFELIGGGIGSTAGGIKQYRVCTSIKGMYYTYKKKLFPSKTISSHYITRMGSVDELTEEEIHLNFSYVLIYLLIFFLGTFIFTLSGAGFEASAFEFASALGTVGLSVGITARGADAYLLWTGTIGMFLGRLEIIVAFNALAKIKNDILRKK